MDNKQLLANLLEQPEMVGPAHVPMLQELLKEYPFAQPIYLLLAKADASFIPKASLYCNHNALYHILQKPSTYTALEIAAEVDVLESFVEIKETEIEKKELAIDENLLLESAITTDFFSFEQALSTDVIATNVPEIETVVPDGIDENIISRYNDDKLPYTFLWWLAKTRKEHEQIFQPYVNTVHNVQKQRPQSAEFQQQYIENIFHIQTPFEVADHLAEYPSTEIKDAKGAEIIERFLKEDPTIKPPKPEQIDNENKAKKSAEDHYDLVSETLAKIYIEQMLYHKAIDTYKKLSLKYPEKSRYFADLIQSIEKKL